MSSRLPTRLQVAIVFGNLACLLCGAVAGFQLSKTTWFNRALGWAFPSGVTENIHFAAACGLGLLIAAILMTIVFCCVPPARKTENCPKGVTQ
jgi:hypothetical protein